LRETIFRVCCRHGPKLARSGPGALQHAIFGLAHLSLGELSPSSFSLALDAELSERPAELPHLDAPRYETLTFQQICLAG